jgi:atrial natriuretic peptide receptor A
MGLAYVFALAPVARMSQHWYGGVPVFTTTSMADELGNRKEYPLLTRLMGTYRTLAKTAYKVISELNPQQLHFFFNDHVVHGNSQGRSECYFSMNTIKNEIKKDVEYTHEMFSERTADREMLILMLKKASFLANSKQIKGK